MKKIVSFINFLAWAALLTHLGLVFNANNFNFTATLEVLVTSYSGAITGLLDVSTDLPYLLKAFAVSLYGIAMVLGFFKVLFQGRIIASLSLLVHLSLVLVFLLTVISDTSLLTSMFTNLSSTDLVVVIENASLLAFVTLSILSFLFIIISFISETQSSKTVVTTKVKDQADPLVIELQKFVVPNQVSIQVPPVIQPQIPSPQPVIPMLSAQPVIQTPPLVAMQEDATLKARETVQVLKEKIRAIIRLQLMNRPFVQPSDPAQSSPTLNTQAAQVDEAMIRKIVQDIFQQEFKEVKAEQKEELSNLVNEELIKYDALNREVIDSMINEKIENQTEQAFQHVSRSASKSGQTSSSDYVTKDELTNALASLPQQAINEEQVRTLVLQILANRNGTTQDSTEQVPTMDNQSDVLVDGTASEEKNAMTSLKKSEVAPEPVVEGIRTTRKTKSKQPKATTVKPSKAEKQPKVEPQKDPPIAVPPVSNDESTNTITIENQFKSVIPPDSPVTRTGKKRIIRVPFPTRMKQASQEVRDHYDTLKNYLLSFKVKSRVSNVGDMFRLHKEEYVKIATAGKGLKLYIALNPKDYESSTIPVDDASDKKIYVNIPLVFKVKSDLSVKRAKVLIDDLMNKKGLTQKTLLDLPWSKQFLD